MVDLPSDPREAADLLEAIARRLRRDPTWGRAAAAASASAGGMSVAPPGLDLQVDEEPAIGAVDVYADEASITVTAETRNADPGSVHVSIVEGRLLIGIGEGTGALRRDLLLPAPVDEEHAYATFRNGVLDIVLPRRDGKKD